MSLLDPRLAAALSNDASARNLLGSLHQQVLTCRDPRALAELLGKYVVAAAAKQTLQPVTAGFVVRRPVTPHTQTEARRYQSISSISKAAHDVATSSITNMKA